MRRPGFKVMHVQDVDFRSTVPTFVAGLKQFANWSATDPRHFPIFVLVELKDEDSHAAADEADPFGAAELMPWTRRSSPSSNAENSTPNDVRGSFASLPKALAKRGWPTLDAARGR